MKRFIVNFLAFILLFAFASCGDYTHATEGGGDPTPPGTEEPENPSEDETGYTFYASLIFNGAPYIPTEQITAQWSDGYTLKRAEFDETGVAKAENLDGDYQVSLVNLPAGYTYNPNIYRATNDEREVEIELYKLSAGNGKGTGLYNCISLSKTGQYRATIKQDNHKIFFEFYPRASGTYSIESWLNVNTQTINPILDVYYGSSQFKVFAYTQDGGGESKGFTKNFYYQMSVSEDMIGNVFTFVVRAEHRNAIYPVDVDFNLVYETDYEREYSNAAWMVPEEMYELFGKELKRWKTLEWSDIQALPAISALSSTVRTAIKEEWQHLKTVDDGKFNDYKTVLEILAECPKIDEYYLPELYASSGSWTTCENYSGGNWIFDGSRFKFNPDTGVYHLYSEEFFAGEANGYAHGYGPILYATISIPANDFLGTAFTMIEYAGNKALTINPEENFKLFIEGYAGMKAQADAWEQAYGQHQELGVPEELVGLKGYADYCKNGVFPVTQELQYFLQGYCENQRLFMDGNGWAETDRNPRIYCAHEDQWLMACGYYI